MTPAPGSNEIAVSSFSLRPSLGSVSFTSVDVHGATGVIRIEGNGTETLPGFIRRVRDECGVSLIEICQVQLADTTADDLGDLAAALAGSGVRLLSMPIDVGDISHPLPDVRERSVLANIQWFDVAQSLGAEHVRINALSPLTASGQGATVEATVESVSLLVTEAADRGLGLLLENKGGLADYPQRMIDVVELLGASEVGVVLDTGNFEPLAGAMIGRLQGKELPSDLGLDHAYKMIALMAPYAAVVHAKSHGFDAEGRQGPMDLEYALGIIKDAGFGGPVIVEYEGVEGDPWVNTRRTVEIVRSVFA